MSAIWSPAGGIRYHLRALRHRERTWRPFRDGLEAWLADWRPKASKLAIVGPSGGYCLPLHAIEHFDQLIVFEPDPIARWLLRRRLRPRSIEFIAQDMWIEPLLRGGSIPSALLERDTALLFTNFVGQLRFLVPDRRWNAWQKTWRKQLWPLLERVPWASFHDRVSGSIAPAVDDRAEFSQRLNDERVQALYEGRTAGELVELLDHGSGELLPKGRRYRYLHWPLTSGAHHLIEAVIG
ncbi:MAG TPA: hypothetical protein VGI70_18585 [Polyangiales bacterium]